MKRAELKSLFDKDTESISQNVINTDILREFDAFILDRIENNFNSEIINVYKKFVPMKQEAPASMKTVLFSTIKSYAKDETSKGNFLFALVLYRFLIVKSNLDSPDYMAIARNLSKAGDDYLYKAFLEIYSQKEENKLLSYIELADFYKEIEDYKNAILCYEKFLEIDGTKAAIYTISADLYSKLNGSDSLEKQIELYEQAYKLQPDNRLVLHGLAFGYEKLGQNVKAKIYYEKLLQNNPTENDYYNYGGFLIRYGDFENGHKYFTHRFNIDDINLKYPANENKKWDFKFDIPDKVLLVHYEQGFGDTIMYSRFVPLLKRIAKKVIFVVQNELYDLISNSHIFEDIEVVTNENDVEYDYNIALLDILYILKFENSALYSLTSEKYLDIAPDKVKNYKDKYLSEDKCFKIGISCSGAQNANYNDRDIDLIKIYSLLKDIPNIKLYNLQRESEFEDIINLGSTFNNFTDSASAVKNMDLIISTDNVILNLAGALGTKTIGLFNKETNFRWYKTDGEDVGWYKSVKPLQAKKQNDWSEVFLKLLKEVKILLGN